MRSPALGSEVLMPFPETECQILRDEPFNSTQLMTRITEIVGDAQRLEPDFGRHVLSIYVNMRRFSTIMTGEVDLVRSFNTNRRHLLLSLLRSFRDAELKGARSPLAVSRSPPERRSGPPLAAGHSGCYAVLRSRQP